MLLNVIVSHITDKISVFVSVTRKTLIMKYYQCICCLNLFPTAGSCVPPFFQVKLLHSSLHQVHLLFRVSFALIIITSRVPAVLPPGNSTNTYISYQSFFPEVLS
jgi:hypothetical protein